MGGPNPVRPENFQQSWPVLPRMLMTALPLAWGALPA